MKKSKINILVFLFTTLSFFTNAQNYIPCPKRIIAYFPFWADRPDKGNYGVDNIPWNKLTHINYAFAGVGSNYKIKLLDSAININNTYPGQNPTLPFKGQFNLINVYKTSYPDVKVLISIGGWAESGGYYEMCADSTRRDIFSQSCVDFLRKYHFDGIDIDFEYPTSAAGAVHPLDEMLYFSTHSGVIYANYVKLMRQLRRKLNEAGSADKKQYLLSIAASGSGWSLSGMGRGEYCNYLDYINIMSYDLHGAWNQYCGPQSATYASTSDPETSMMDQPTLNIDWIVKYYSGILHPSKINVGIPYYSRGWTQVSGGINGLWGTSPSVLHTFSYVHNGNNYSVTRSIGKGAGGIEGIWNDPSPEPDAGANPLWHVYNLLLNPGTKTYDYLAGTALSGPQSGITGYTRHFDNTTKTVSIWNAAKQTFLTYEDTVSLRHKLDYINSRGLGGMMFWELSGDYHYDAAKGYYTAGNDMTTYAYNYFKTHTPVLATDRVLPAAVNTFNYSFSGTYSHPNYSPQFTIYNLSSAPVPGGWTVEFDLPKSTRYDATWGTGTLTLIDGSHPLWNRWQIVGPAYAAIPAGGSYVISGAMKLCFSGGPLNVVFNGSSTTYETNLSIDTSCHLINEIHPFTNHEEQWVAIYPNPTTGTVFLSVKNKTDGELEILDVKGQKVLAQKLTEGTNEISMQHISNGMYFVRLQLNQEIYHQKIIKQ